MDSQSVKTVEESARIRGFDAHKHVKGRKRHILVDTLGLPLSVSVTPADLHDTQGARRLLAGLKYFVPRLKTIWADAAYRSQEHANWCKAQGDWDLDVVERAAGVRGIAVLPKRWIVEWTFGWISRNRRLCKDYDRKVQTSETLIEVVMIRLLIARQGRRKCRLPKHGHMPGRYEDITTVDSTPTAPPRTVEGNPVTMQAIAGSRGLTAEACPARLQEAFLRSPPARTGETSRRSDGRAQL
jgi:transposase